MKFESVIRNSPRLLCPLPSFGPCHAQQYSPEFQASSESDFNRIIFRQEDNLSSMRNQYPNVVAALVGMPWGSRRFMSSINPSLEHRFARLSTASQVYITDVARTTSLPVSEMRTAARWHRRVLWFVVNKFYQGQEDAWILARTFVFEPGRCPRLWLLALDLKNRARLSGSTDQNSKNKNQIELFGYRGSIGTKGSRKQRPRPSLLETNNT